MQDRPPSDETIFGDPAAGLISRVTAYWKLHYADQRPRKELAEACMEIITRERDLWSLETLAITLE